MTDDPVSRIEAALNPPVLSQHWTDFVTLKGCTKDDIRALLDRLQKAEEENERLREFERSAAAETRRTACWTAERRPVRRMRSASAGRWRDA